MKDDLMPPPPSHSTSPGRGRRRRLYDAAPPSAADTVAPVLAPDTTDTTGTTAAAAAAINEAGADAPAASAGNVAAGTPALAASPAPQQATPEAPPAPLPAANEILIETPSAPALSEAAAPSASAGSDIPPDTGPLARAEAPSAGPMGTEVLAVYPATVADTAPPAGDKPPPPAVLGQSNPPQAPCARPRSPLLRRIKARQTIRDHALLAGGAMAIPVPFVDMAAEAAIQLRMVRRLSEIHGVDFAEERAKALLAAALGGFSAGWAAGKLLRYASFATYFTNFWPSAMVSSAITYGIGQLFEQHFEKGGNLHDLHPRHAESLLRERARRLRARLAGGKAAPPPAP